MTGAALVSSVLAGAAVLALPSRGGAPGRRVLHVARRSSIARASGPDVPRRDAADRVQLREVVALADHLAGAFRAGLAPARAWAAFASGPGRAAGIAQAVLSWIELGIPPGRALWLGAQPPPGSPLVPVVVALDLCDRTGAPAAEVLDGVAAALRAEEAAAHETAVALAAPRATVRVMTALPAAGLGMAALLGADTLHVLLATTAGHVCLALGGCLWVIGHWWIRRLVKAAGTAGAAGSAEGGEGQ